MATPAAVLSIMVKAEGVQRATAQLNTLDASAKKAAVGQDELAKSSSRLHSGLANIAKAAGAAVVAYAGIAEAKAAISTTTNLAKATISLHKNLGLSVKAASEWAAVAEARNIDTKALNMSFGTLAKNVQAGAIGFDKMNAKTGDLKTQMNALGTSTKDQVKLQALQDSLHKTLAKGAGAQADALKRLGVSESQIKSGNFNDVLRTVSDGLGEMHAGTEKTALSMKLFGRGWQTVVPILRGGSKAMDEQLKLAEKYGVTFQGKTVKSLQDLINAQRESKLATMGLQIALGTFLAPALAKAMAFTNQLVLALRGGKATSTQFSDGVNQAAGALRTLGGVLQFVIGNFKTFITNVRMDTDMMLGWFTAVLDGMHAIAELGSHLPGVGGKFKSLADRIDRSRDRINALRTEIRPTGHQFDSLNSAADSLGSSLASNMGKGAHSANVLGGAITSVNTKFAGLQHAADSALSGLADAIKKPARALKPVGDGLGKVPSIVPLTGGGGNLMGARPSMAPFASAGARFGLHVSSGLRRGAITTSGNTSYHSTGEAIDEAGSPAGMMGFFKFMKSTYGSSLAELIYGPGRIGIKNGQPFNFGQALNAQHMDHVHVAFDTGKPGVGDGFGRARAALTGDGPGKLSGQQLANLWVRAGGDPKVAGLMARIAIAESGGNPAAHNKSGATGLWQILGAMTKGNLTNPLTNARNAVAKYKSQGLGAWAASKPSWGKYVGHPGISAGKSASKGAAGVAKVNPYDQKIASADVAVADAGHAIGKFSAGLRTAAALRVKQQIVGSRIRAVRAALKGKLTPATRLRLTQELGQLIPEHKQLGLDRQTALAGPATTGGGAGSTDLGGDFGGGADTVDNTDAINALNDTITQLNAKIDLQGQQHDELQRNLNTSQSQYGVLAKAIADVASGQIGGKAGLGFMTPSFAGGMSRY